MKELIKRIYRVFVPLKTIKDLRQEAVTAHEGYRDKLKILIIDDKDVPLISNLKSMGYRITHWTDVEDINQLSAYPIIISDVQGVGKCFKTDNGGIEIIRQSIKINPLKEYALYSAATYELSTPLAGVSVIEKDFDSDDWSDTLDSMFVKVSDPKKRWQKIQRYLIERGISSLELAELEDEYVTVTLKGESLKDFPKKKTSYSLEINTWIQALINLAVTQ